MMMTPSTTFCSYPPVAGDDDTTRAESSRCHRGHERTTMTVAANSLSRLAHRLTDAKAAPSPCSDDSSVSSASPTTCSTISTSADSEGKVLSTSYRRSQEKGQSPSPSSPSSPLRSVRFNENIRCLVIPGVWQMPQHEIDDTWYGPTDSLRQKKEMKRTVRHMRSHGLDHVHGETLDGSKYCYRGLEHLRSATVLQRQQQEQSLAINTVLEAQDASSFTSSYIAIVSEAATKNAKKRALLAARRDEAEVMKCL